MLYYEARDKLLGKHFFNKKKQYTIDLYTIYDLDKRIIYILTDFLNIMHDIRV